MLAESHKIARQGIRSFLENKNGLEIIGEAEDGLEAFSLVTEYQPDLLMTDMRMPKMNGVELTKKIKESFPDVKVFVLSLYSIEVYVYLALAAGANGYVFKNADIQNLDIAIHKVLRG